MRQGCPLSRWSGADGHCQWCDGAVPAGRRRVWCQDACRRAWERNHLWRHARIHARKRAGYRCTRAGCEALRMDVEVNHRTPRDGAGYGPGCHHHQDPDEHGRGGLEALCHAHHVEVTNAQRTARRDQRRASATLA